ncbi:hypothetical protein GSI_14803 [Ganoderma sinense ZZ0214-1]|uniref:Uncharacterized protein n=1 Tax=Ganoderma sinense ZZ0214-1 TaxID=1077348 RepID=A0A2G8RPQ9_9APHY|nr:hypothetical protein GSI_14803 [Ganoderma sinense ZZ0214-1]
MRQDTLHARTTATVHSNTPVKPNGLDIKSPDTDIDPTTMTVAVTMVDGGKARKASKTLTWLEIPEWQRDNEYILTGYRRTGIVHETLSELASDKLLEMVPHSDLCTRDGASL